MPFSKRENTDSARQRAQAHRRKMSSVWDVLNVRCLWDISVDMSRKQMARTACIDLWEEARPELTALRDRCRVERQTGPFERTGAQRKRSIRHSAYTWEVREREANGRSPEKESKCH